MPGIDQFESQFKAAVKDRLDYRHTSFRSVVVLTDLPADEAAQFCDSVQEHCRGLLALDDASWRSVPGAECATIGDVLAIVEHDQPDLVCTYRNLHSGAWKWPHSLSDHLEVLTQVAPMPVLLLPRPKSGGGWSSGGPVRTVMAVTDHLSGDDLLVNAAVSMVPKDGTLVLTHVEDQQALERVLGAIGKIPELDSELARERIRHQLLREARDYIDSCTSELAAQGLALEVRSEVLMGRSLQTHQGLVEQHAVDLLVLHTKDEDQMAMHGLAYPLAVELRDVAMLLL